METIGVRAECSILGMNRGDVDEVELTDAVVALVDSGRLSAIPTVVDAAAQPADDDADDADDADEDE